ncbi:phosphotransferase family protein [Phytoactinopolyspora halotolerans]|uniref:Phosphotransferase n=1 Tax=Phytoactinopolyspora halotolerans TaxID=1981512 RepID=A0A6L9S9H0_9ACTN|nr:phosphotransferase [Phytoactinopolyspora halotolerans]NEE01683.1 phosphotransferase [Phytoactinopolyspora halotolerans]
MADQSALPDAMLALLTGPDVDELLAAALAPAGARLEQWTVRDVDHRPGRRTTVSYAVHVAWPGGVRAETFAATVTPGGTPAQEASTDRLVVTDGDHEIEVWRFPFDAELPALAAMCFEDSAIQTLRSLGIDAAGAHVDVLSYRPRKRAVIRVSRPGATWYVKVLRPAVGAEMRRRHELLTDAGLPVPVCLAARDDGLLVLSEVPGTPLGSALTVTGAAACDPMDLISMLDRLPAELLALPRRRPWAEYAQHYAGVIASTLPSEAARVHDVAAEIDVALSAYAGGTVEPTHGDFYEAQLMVDDGRITGLLDVDTAGPGRRVDDLACMLAHLSLLTILETGAARGAREALEWWTPVFDRRVDPRELRVRTAGVIVSLATGAFRSQEAGWERSTSDRLTLARLWLDAAGGLRIPV